MTRLNVAHAMPPKPSSVALSELAITAGAAGHGMTLCFEEFPAPTLCQLWRHCIRYSDPEAVHHIHTQADIRRLGKVIDQVRLVLVYNPRLRNAASWVIQTSCLTCEDSLTMPTLFCGAVDRDADENPGATIVLRGDGPEQVAVAQWLLAAENDRPDWAAIPPRVSIQSEPALGAALLALSPLTAAFGGLRNGQVLQALLAGATLVRSLPEVSDGANLTTSVEDYELVRRLLQTRLVAGADEACDPLAADMVGRVNLFIAMRNGTGSGSDPAVDDARRPPRELVTRREVSDLGNVRSRTVRRLVEFVKRQPDGYERFRRIGLMHRPPERNAWRRVDINDLIACLRSWTYKQVRTRFDELHRAGMITAQREHPNGPWQYGLPEQMTARSIAFRGLPSAQEIDGHNQAP